MHASCLITVGNKIQQLYPGKDGGQHYPGKDGGKFYPVKDGRGNFMTLHRGA